MSYLRYLCLFGQSGVQHILFVGGLMSYLRYLCLFGQGDVQHILFVGGLMSYLRYLCLFGQGGVQHILFFALFFFVLCTAFVSFSGLSIFDCLFGII